MKTDMRDLPTPYQSQIFRAHYARWREEDKRRENWPEAVERYVNFMVNQAKKFGYEIPEPVVEELRESFLAAPGPKGGAVGSMRALASAGKALERDNAAAYNCVYVAIDRPQAFDETLYLLSCGTGVGYSVERQYINKLPEVPTLYPTDTTIVVRDSKIGWANALRQLIHLLYAGNIPKWDTSNVRPAGARLKTFGGRASGPAPLEDLFRYVIAIFNEAQGRKLTSTECHGIQCKIGDAIIVAGTRRSALIALFNPSDDRMRDAKSGQWQNLHPEYRLANNSAAWTEKPDMERFLSTWVALVKSKAGEPGIINREGMKKHAAKNGRRDVEHEFGTNPCAEIILRDREFCNLCEVVVRPQDTYEDLCQKVRLAAIWGTIQSTLTDFRYLSTQYKKNCEEERLLGVSLTGIMDHPFLSGRETNWASAGGAPLSEILQGLRNTVIATNAEWAELLGIEPAAAATCVKPSGNGSQLFNCASGIHSRHSRYYIRTNRLSNRDPLAQFLQSAGVPFEEDIMDPNNTLVFAYPIAAPETAVTRKDISALEHLNLWLVYAEHWCEHKPSITVSVREDEWLEVGAFVYKNFDRMSGISFLPYSDHVYQQAPYQEVTEEEWQQMIDRMPTSLDWTRLSEFELEDNTTSMQELACTAGFCEVA